jgi:hypothetical protein
MDGWMDGCRVPEEKPVCEWHDHDFEALEMGMGFHQMAVRLLVWLVLNHIQVFISRLVYTLCASKTKEQEKLERCALPLSSVSQGRKPVESDRLLTHVLYRVVRWLLRAFALPYDDAGSVSCSNEN